MTKFSIFFHVSLRKNSKIYSIKYDSFSFLYNIVILLTKLNITLLSIIFLIKLQYTNQIIIAANLEAEKHTIRNDRRKLQNEVIVKGYYGG